MKKAIHIRMSEKLHRELERVANELGIDKSNCARLALRLGLRFLDRMAFNFGIIAFREAIEGLENED